jgi:Flp pilus assembly protein TadD
MASIDLALDHFQKGQFRESFAELQGIKGIERVPAGRILLGSLLLELNRPLEALPHLEAALKLAPRDVTGLTSYARALARTGRLKEALATFDRMLGALSESAEIHWRKGWVLHEAGRFDEAISAFDRGLALDPDYADIETARGMTRLLTGDWARGLKDYEARYRRRLSPVKMPDTFDCPVWRGEDLRGKKILVHAEQGMGDTIQFARLTPRLVEMGARVVFGAPDRLARLLAPFAQVMGLRNTSMPGEVFDYTVPLMSLPCLLGLTPETIPPAVPYLFAEREIVQRWGAVIDKTGFRVGIAWQGNPAAAIDEGRSIPLARLAPLAKIPGVRLISLQKQHGLDQLANLPAGMTVETLGPDFDAGPDAFVDTAAVMAGLDLIVTTDTSIAHLAGALGRPTLVLLQQVPEWRWGVAMDTSPWYPTVRLMRQSRAGDWGELGRRTAKLVERLAKGEEHLPIAGDPPMAMGLMHEARDLSRTGDQAEAARLAELARPLTIGRADLQTQLIWTLTEMGQAEAAADVARESLTFASTHAGIRFARAQALLTTGDYTQGFADFEWRLDPLRGHIARPEVPLHNGEPLEGLRLLVVPEQGIGDLIQFARFLPLLADRGATVTLEAKPRLHYLFKDLDPRIRLISSEGPAPDVDLKMLIMSLCYKLGTGAETLPPPIALRADPQDVARWKDRIGDGGLRIAIAWQGNPSGTIDKGRSPPVSVFAPLAALPGVRLVSLQKEHGLEQLGALPNGLAIETLGAEFDAGPDAFRDAIAVMAAVDLVITSDTALAHVAGSMGLPAIVLLKKVPDWRWGNAGTSNRWYPSLSLVRQTQAGDWAGVGRQLAEIVAARLSPGPMEGAAS